ncbi:MAG: hypothetical protein ABI411_21410 [Tahibacter sp.]
MNQKAQEKLEVSRDVVEQLNTMVRSSAGRGGPDQGPDTSPPGPPPTPQVAYDE